MRRKLFCLKLTIYFLVNKSNIRTTEKSELDVKKLQDFIKLGYKTESFVVKSFTPEGKEKINTQLSMISKTILLNIKICWKIEVW